MEKNRKLILALSSILLIGCLGLFLYKKEIKVENISEEEYQLLLSQLNSNE